MAVRAAALFLLASSALGACPAGTTYESSFNKCYKYIPQAANFLSAEKNCENFGGSLVSLQNSFENGYLSGIAGSSSFWIGLNLLTSSQWTWINGLNGTYVNWASGQSQELCNRLCAAQNSSSGGLWTKELCSTQLPYMCQIDPNYVSSTCGSTTSSAALTTASSVTVPTTKSCPNGRCPDGSYKLYPDNCKCYKYYSSGLHRDDAAQACSRESATLAIILNKEENNLVSSFALGASSIAYDVWIGLTCNGTLTSCQWMDGIQASYTNFKSDYYSSDVLLYPMNGIWSSFPSGDWMQPYICQQSGIP